ncbi:MAG: CHAT domain-containing protein, partial [Bacteroidota bacterium]
MTKDQRSTIIVVYQNIGSGFELLGDIKKAIFYLKKSIRLSLEYYDGSDLQRFNLGRRYALLGNTFSKVENYIEALQNFKIALGYLENGSLESSIHKENLLLLYQNLSNLFLEKGDLNKASSYISEAINIRFDKFSIRAYKSFELLGKIAHAKGNSAAARKYFRTSIDKINETEDFLDKEAKPRQYFLIGEIDLEEGHYTNALQNLQTAIINMTFEYEDTSFTSNPPIQQMISEPLAFKILHYKAKTLHRLFDQTQDLRYLDAALDAAKVSAALVEKSRQEIVTQGSKQKLAGDALEVYETGIEIALALQEEKGDQKYLEEAFAFAESNKAILLLESINETVAKSYGGIPDSSLEQEKDQRINIAFYEKEIYQERQKEEADEEKLKLWENQLFEYKQDYQALVKRLEGEFPEYYEMKYNTHLASLSGLQERVIKDGEALVEYFVGVEKIYVFVVSKGAAEVIALEKAEDYEVPIFALRDAILEVDNGVQFYQAILSKSSELYDLYFAPIAEKLPAGTERILLVTDDALGYLPFEVLLRKHPRLADRDITFSPEVLEYLFEDYLINYHYSSTLLEKSYEF